MKTTHPRRIFAAILAACALVVAAPDPARAEVADLADVPLANSPSDAVLPNLMYILDDSGSMQWDYMPDNIQKLTDGTTIRNCKSCTTTSCSLASRQCALGNSGSSDGNTADYADPPYYSTQFNQIYYNPDITYTPGNDYQGVSLGNATPTAAKKDAYVNATTKDLTANYPEVYYCNTSTPTTAQLTDTTVCRRNGVDNVAAAPNDYFLYWSNNKTAGTPMGAYPVQDGTTSGSFNNQVVRNTGHPYYFIISPDEYCKDRNLVECTNSSVPTGAFVFPAPVRYCSSTANASAASPVSDAAGTTNPKCRQKFNSGSYLYPRYGRFRRVDIVPTTTTYAKSATARRTDCASATVCTYAEELQNFANWYSYYHIRMTMMKTATGRAFLPIDDRYRVGFITINPMSSGSVTSSRYLPIAPFNATQKSDWYTKLYATGSNGSTPLREALSRVGRHYAGVTTGINNGMSEDPVQYSCQQNFALLTTDGYYNDSTLDTYDISGNRVGDQDDTPSTTLPFFVSRATGTLDATGTQVVTHTPSTTVSQVICTGNNTTAFPGGGSNTACGCSGSERRIKQRTQVGTSDATTVDGVPSGTGSTVTSTTFQNISACTTPHIVTTVTRITEREQDDCRRNNSTSFSSSGAANDPGNVNCGCSFNSQHSLWQRTITYDQTVVTTDGAVTSSTRSNWITRTFATVGSTCVGSVSVALNPNPTASAGTPTVTDNGGTTLDISGFTPNPQTTTTGSPTTTTTNGGTANTLADVAMYYYKTDLRTTGSTTITVNNVPTTDKDIQPAQHMVTFTLGLGLQGLMDYIADYESNALGDFANIKAGTAGACPWTTAGAQCNWPVPVAASPTALDDLWHAAVNGRGVYYSASDPNSLADGLAGALSALHVQTAAASASATSSPNITQTDNFIYSSTFRTVKWDGEIVAQHIDPTNGNVLPAIAWSAQSLLDGMTSAATDTRTIYTFSAGASNNLVSFDYANLTSADTGAILAQQPYFSGKCTSLAQCSLLTIPQQAIANDGTAMVNFLRGQRGNESTIFRIRDHVMGDPINATPAFVRAPTFAFQDSVTPTYDSFKTANASRSPTLYIAANDGMLHAFNGDTGVEIWAYVPNMVLPNMYKLATDNWDVQHKYSVDGSPQVMDVFDSGAGAWKTILVGGLNKGGRGFYALDITNPASPKGMWETCGDATVCANTDPDLGYSYGNAVITKRASDGRWVVLVTSGINNVSPGTGKGYLFVLDAFTGAILRKVEAIDGTTTFGDTTTPSGFSKISAFANNFNTDNTATFVYGGDLLGNVWRFDMSIDPPAVQKLGALTDSGGRPQSITTRPELGVVQGNRVLFIGTGRYLGTNDLVDPATLVPAEQWAYGQTLYAFKDRGINYGDIRTSTSNGLVQQTITDSSGIRTISNNPVDWNTKDGWYVDFNPGGTSPGERVNLDPLLVLGTLVVTTNIPGNSACTVGGDSFIYQFDYRSGSYVSTSFGGVVGTKQSGQITVGVVIVRLPSGVFKGIATGATGTKTPFAVNIGGSGGAPRRVSWRELIQ